MPPIEIGPSRPVGAVQAKTVVAPAAPSAEPVKAATAQSASAAPQVETSDAVKAGDAPVDAERVAKIRRAIEDGHYPVIPTRIADAMIAAGMLLRNPQ
ncbi:flagellar biosynthesis anti-sigma factor FlgM [Novosphingobium sp. KCTC 2891]|uniref:flagellar biosynthesis anti-sigma factor FlgM n=1 Tax=Novosphingobium sp. KCTC 2891 TaxID=2989730 RepID=UPI002221CBB7|nr:flagellar biosynthesis anti-sigma factor FlgM [Novosphingobium sp. KCTC 2891]MCW1382986.1 flagellar biosynthesis anti-sigma factor FlgM [Novosphingobium sp. KCTC 2891]